MKTADIQAVPAPPSLIGSLLAGFDAVANHIDLVLLPVLIDLFLWLGPHLRIRKLVDGVVSQVFTQPGSDPLASADVLRLSREFWVALGQRLNVFSGIRSYPIGIPSLMASTQPLETPLGQPVYWEVGSIWIAVLFFLFIAVLGIAAGTLYFSIISQAAISGGISWRETIARWPREISQVLLLALLWIAALALISIPASCVLSMILFMGLPLGGVAVFLLGGLVLWVLYPLLFSPHGIFVNQFSMKDSVRESVRITRLLMPKTALFFMIVLLLDEGFTLLWQVPRDTTWLALIGVVGHAFITTGLIAASFVYYRDAARWKLRLVQQAQLTTRT